MKKRILSLAIATSTLVMAMPIASAYTFSDIEAEQYSWCAPQIEEMNAAGYINGYEDGTYRPDNEVTKLECIALFSRAMGAADENNDEVMALAHEQYDSALKTSSLAWGEDELAYMMYKGALTAADLTTYINGDAKNLPMTRGEAAVIITKAMGGEGKATADAGVSLHYKDASEIPSNLLQYVEYVTDEGIMNGIDDAFCYGNTVTRSQIAVMLSRVIEKCDYSFKKGRITDIDTEESMIYYSVDGTEYEYQYTDDVDFFIKGERAQAKDIPSNVSVLIQFSGEYPVIFDTMSDTADEDITAYYVGYNSSSTTLKIKVKKDENTTKVDTYTCDIDVPITYQGSPATIKAIQPGDAIVISMSDGKVQAIAAAEKSIDITGATVANIKIDGDKVYMTISSNDSKYDGKTYPIGDYVSVTKNGKSSDMASIYVGDSVSITLKYGEIVKVRATAVNNTVEGVLTNISIGDTTEITMNISGKEYKYIVPVNCSIEKGNEEVDIYSLRLNDTLKLTVQSDAVVKISAIATNTVVAGKVSGTVSAVNTSYKFVAVLTEGSTVPTTVYVDANTKYTVVRGSSTGASLSTIKAGDSVECYVSSKNGAYVASDVVIVKAD